MFDLFKLDQIDIYQCNFSMNLIVIGYTPNSCDLIMILMIREKTP